MFERFNLVKEFPFPLPYCITKCTMNQKFSNGARLASIFFKNTPLTVFVTKEWISTRLPSVAQISVLCGILLQMCKNAVLCTRCISVYLSHWMCAWSNLFSWCFLSRYLSVLVLHKRALRWWVLRQCVSGTMFQIFFFTNFCCFSFSLHLLIGHLMFSLLQLNSSKWNSV